MSDSEERKDESELSALLCVARTVDMPDWATHVAVRNDGSKAEPAAWLERAQDYLDEDPAQLGEHCWAGSYKNCYWTFFERAQLST